jgi:hypothetical protein
MRFGLYHIPRLVLALVLIATSASMATARDQTRAAVGQMQLCTGQAVVTVLMDHNGQLVQTPHICPDCVVASGPELSGPELSGLALPVTAFGGPAFQPRRHELEFETVDVSAGSLARRHSRARDPPQV